jgi:hypothetical protein
MHPLFPGLETVEDRVFWKHYNEHLSTVLTVEGEHRNAFKDVMIPIAVKEQSLMHSILSLAGKHIDFDTPYGINVLRNNPNTTLEALRARSAYHHDQARLRFYHGAEFNGKLNTDDRTLLWARYGQMLCFLLEALIEGDTRGEHRLHLTVYRNLASTAPPDGSAFMSFITEVFQYYLFADELLYSATNMDACSSSVYQAPPMPQIHTPRLLGVADGLLGYLSRITAMRNIVRANMLERMDPAVGYPLLYLAVDMDDEIREPFSHWPPGDGRDRVSQLYQLMLWIYLHRTVYPPSVSTPASMASSVASISFIHNSPSHGRAAASSVVNTPPRSTSTSCTSSPRLTASSHGRSDSRSSRPHSRMGPSSRTHDSNQDAGEASSAGERADSPPPIRRPSYVESTLISSVEESLALLESFKPSDPCQTLLLLPCFLVGTACFTPVQQKRLRAAVRTFRGYTGMRSADRVVQVLEEVWRLMEAGDWVAAWDWAGVAERLGLDFLPV